MLSRRLVYSAVIALAMLVGCIASIARAQMPEDPMGLPIQTTIVLIKPGPEEIFGNRLVISIGVGGTIYKFILKDAYTNHMYVRWPSIWELVRQSAPNLVAQGPDSEKFGQVQPGSTVTVSGMFTAAQRTFEIVSMEPGETRFGSNAQHY